MHQACSGRVPISCPVGANSMLAVRYFYVRVQQGSKGCLPTSPPPPICTICLPPSSGYTPNIICKNPDVGIDARKLFNAQCLWHPLAALAGVVAHTSYHLGPICFGDLFTLCFCPWTCIAILVLGLFARERYVSRD